MADFRTVRASFDDLNKAWHAERSLWPRICPDRILHLLLEQGRSYSEWRRSELLHDARVELFEKAKKARLEAFLNRPRSRTPPRGRRMDRYAAAPRHEECYYKLPAQRRLPDPLELLMD